jgi:hypothetical protein
VAIVREICRRYAAGEIRGIPSAHVVRLTVDGTLLIEGPLTTDQPAVGRAGQLLAEVLPPFGAPRAYHVPGGLRLIVARATGAIDLPPFASVEQFTASLDRFAAEDLTAVLRDAFTMWQAAREPRVLTISDVRRARRATGLSLEDIAAVSGIEVPRLRELEWGYVRRWASDDSGRAELGRYARAAGLDEQLVMSVAWPMIEEAAGPDDAVAPVAATSEALVPLGPQAIATIVPFTERRRKRISAAWLTIAAAILILIALTLTFSTPPPATTTARVETVPDAVVDSRVPVEQPAAIASSPKLRPAARPAVRPAVNRRSAHKPSFFKRELFRIVIR